MANINLCFLITIYLINNSKFNIFFIYFHFVYNSLASLTTRTKKTLPSKSLTQGLNHVNRIRFGHDLVLYVLDYV